MTRDKCTICIGRGNKEQAAFHEIAWDGKYIHLCHDHYWMLHKYFEFWIVGK